MRLVFLLALSIPLLAARCGDSGNCTVAKNPDTGVATITCTDGSSVDVGPGPAGPTGTAGTNCTATRDGDAGITRVQCEDGTSATVLDGAHGTNGSPGADGAPGANGAPGVDGAPGAPCTVSRDPVGKTTTVTCPDGTSSVIPDGQAGAAGQPGTQCTATRNADAGMTTLTCSDGTSTQVVDGYSSLTRLQDESPGQHCPSGGLKVSSGLDLDRNGELDPSEVTDVAYVCGAGQSATDAGSNVPLDGGNYCSPSNCTGCCLNNVCLSGWSVTACGQQGQVCSACAGGQECAQGMCQAAQSCSGCKDLVGNCQAGTSVVACGAAGGMCKTCSSGQSCIDGACVGCDPTSCPEGCCDGTTCITGASLSVSKCGSAGASCAACSTGATCNIGQQGGTCTGGTGGGLGGGFGGGTGGGTGSGCSTCTDALGNCVVHMDDQNCNPDLSSALLGSLGTVGPCTACAVGTTCQPDSFGLGLYCQ